MMNNLTVDHHHQHANPRLTRPRKSVIGKLERSSFQAQRLSDVGIAFSQQITAKVGLKLPASQERIVEQTRWLYLRYVFVKLRLNKLPLKDLNLTKGSRSRRAAALLSGTGGTGGGGGIGGIGVLSNGVGGDGHFGGGGGGGTPSSPIVVSISEPSSADALSTSLMSDQRPLFTRQASIRQRQSSVFMPVQLNSEELSLLNERMSSRRKNQRLGSALVMPPEMNMRVNMLKMEDGVRDVDDSDHHTSAAAASAAAAASQLNGSQKMSFTNKTTENIAAIVPPSSLSFDPKQKLFTRSHSIFATPSPSLPPAPLPLPSMSPAATTAGRKYIMDPTINNQILTVIMDMINNELRESKPEFYGDTIYEVIGLDKFSSLDSLLDVQRTICQEMTRVDISWDRIVALFSLFGAMSLDCVRLGAPEHVGPILDGFIGFVERDLALWISQQGGWESFLYKHRADYRYGPFYKAAAIALPVLLALVFAYS